MLVIYLSLFVFHIVKHKSVNSEMDIHQSNAAVARQAQDDAEKKLRVCDGEKKACLLAKQQNTQL